MPTEFYKQSYSELRNNGSTPTVTFCTGRDISLAAMIFYMALTKYAYFICIIPNPYNNSEGRESITLFQIKCLRLIDKPEKVKPETKLNSNKSLFTPISLYCIKLPQRQPLALGGTIWRCLSYRTLENQVRKYTMISTKGNFWNRITDLYY